MQPPPKRSNQSSHFYTNEDQPSDTLHSSEILNNLADESDSTNTEPNVRKVPFASDNWDMFRFDCINQQDNIDRADAVTDELDGTFYSTGDTSILDNREKDNEVQDIRTDDESVSDETVSEGTEPDETISHAPDTSILPRESQYTLKLTEFSSHQLSELAKIHNITINGPKFDKISQINSWFRENFPDHARSPRGILVFPTNYKLKTEVTLKELKRNFLLSLMADYGIPRPILYRKSEDLRKHIKSFLDKNMPEHPKDETGLYIFTTRSPVPQK